ncbi:hypothetical protein MTO96_052244 [Rhipicephalus appendiculatus]
MSLKHAVGWNAPTPRFSLSLSPPFKRYHGEYEDHLGFQPRGAAIIELSVSISPEPATRLVTQRDRRWLWIPEQWAHKVSGKLAPGSILWWTEVLGRAPAQCVTWLRS